MGFVVDTPMATDPSSRFSNQRKQHMSLSRPATAPIAGGDTAVLYCTKGGNCKKKPVPMIHASSDTKPAPQGDHIQPMMRARCDASEL